MTTGDWAFIIRAGKVEKRMIHGFHGTAWAGTVALEGGIYRKPSDVFSTQRDAERALDALP